tara:strand:+ start:1756 stop:5178 length:3423 start_codon:yes stop_codon:yes gene_type:complete
MGQIGNTAFFNTTTGGTALITDTFVQLNDGGTNNETDTTAPVNAVGQADETGVIFNVKVPERNEVLDSNSNVIPEDVTFSSLQFEINRTVAPSGGAGVYGYLLKDELNLELVTHDNSDGTTAWEPAWAGTTNGRVIYKSLIIPNITVPDATGVFAFTLNKLTENEITFGSEFQFIMYSTVDMTIGLMNNTNAALQPKLKIFFDKPVPKAPTIEVVADNGGINGIIKITPSEDKAVVKHRIDTNIDGLTAQESTDFTDVGREEILTTELTKDSGISIHAAGGGSGIAYTNIFPLAFDSGNSIDTTGNGTGDTPARTTFRLYAEDNYNTDTNGGSSNIVTINRPAITMTDSASGAINIGDENVFTLTTSKDGTTGAGVGDFQGQFTEYAFHPSVDDIVVDTGVTVTVGTLNSSDTIHTFSSDISFEVGDLIKIDSEYLRVVGFEGSNNRVAFVRGALGSTAASHSVGASIFKVDDTNFLFTKLTSPTSLHTFSYKYPKAKTSHTAVAYVKDVNGFRSDPAHIAVNVSESNPIAKLSASRTKVPYAQYGDNVAGLTLSLANSKAIGSDNELTNYLFSYRVGKGTNSAIEPQPIACANGLSNDNSCFDSGSKRVAIVNCGERNVDYADTKFKIFGVASFQGDGTSPTSDTNTGGTFSHYKYVSEIIAVNAARLTESISTNFYKSIDCVVAVDIDEHDTACTRYLLKVANADVETNEVAKVNGSGLASDSTVTTVTVDSPDSRNYDIGDFIKLEDEIMQVVAIPHATQLTVIRGMMFSVAATHANDIDVKVVNHNIMINRDLRLVGNDAVTPTTSDGAYWKWGGFARIVGSSAGDGIDFDTDETIELQTVLDANSTGVASVRTDWYEHGFLEGDIIKVGNTTDNGSYTSPKYFKIIKIFTSGGGVDVNDIKDIIKIADTTDLLTDDEALYITTSIGTQNTDMAADIVRYDNALNPSRTVTLSSYNSSTDVYDGEADDFLFAGGVIDATNTGTDATAAAAPWIFRDSYTETIVRGVTPRTLDLDSLAVADIAILNTSISRSGGVNAAMALGDRKYPITGFNTKLGNITLNANIRVLTQTGFRQIWSLIEGDRYDFVFLDSSQIDTPTTVYKSYRLKLTSGSINKSPDNASQYLAALKFVVVGEEIA